MARLIFASDRCAFALHDANDECVLVFLSSLFWKDLWRRFFVVGLFVTTSPFSVYCFARIACTACCIFSPPAPTLNLFRMTRGSVRAASSVTNAARNLLRSPEADFSDATILTNSGNSTNPEPSRSTNFTSSTHCSLVIATPSAANATRNSAESIAPLASSSIKEKHNARSARECRDKDGRFDLPRLQSHDAAAAESSRRVMTALRARPRRNHPSRRLHE